VLIFPPDIQEMPEWEGRELAVEASRSVRPGHAVLVEDNDLLRKHIKRILEELDFVVHECADANTCIEKFTIFDKIDLVITDIILQDSLDGWQLGQHIEGMNKEIPIVYMSGFIDESDHGPPEQNAILRKPFTRQELIRAIETAQQRASV
jgi:CheY-like chemotaxis protein